MPKRLPTSSTVPLALMVALVAHCGTGEVVWTGDGDGDADTDDCPGGCRWDQRCVEGVCVNEDPCQGVTCDPGELCAGGVCVAEEIDGDRDGYPEGIDCDDSEVSVHPGAVESCNGVDDDCDDAVDEGFDLDRDGYTSCEAGVPGGGDCDDDDGGVHPGAAEACNGVDEDCNGIDDDGIADRPCTTACGDGTERCLAGAWECDAPATCDCATVGAEDTDECGLCGTRSRSCESDHSWGDWGPCEEEGDCSPGDRQTRDCERCGVESRTCEDDCRWGSWGTCTGMGACDPGARDDSACDSCSEQVCASDCRWGPCELKSTSECDWRSGTHFRCCGTGMWQYCLSSCLWSTDCAPCNCTTSCPSCC